MMPRKMIDKINIKLIEGLKNFLMKYSSIKSYAKLNLALNITGKTSSLHKIESIVAFVESL